MALTRRRITTGETREQIAKKHLRCRSCTTYCIVDGRTVQVQCGLCIAKEAHNARPA